MNGFTENFIAKYKLNTGLRIFMLIFSISLTLSLFVATKISVSNIIINKYLAQYLQNTHECFELNLNDIIVQVNMHAHNITSNNTIYDTLVSAPLNQIEKQNQIETALKGCIPQSSLINNVLIVDNNGMQYKYSVNGVPFEACNPDFITTQNNYDIFISEDVMRDENGEAYIVFGKKLKNFNMRYNAGYLMMYIKSSYISSAYATPILNDTNTFITFKNHIISHNDSSALGKYMYDLNGLFKNNKIIKNSTGEYIINQYELTKIPISGLSMTSVVSLQEFRKSMHLYNLRTLIVLIFNTLFSLIITMVITHNLTKSIEKLLKRIISYGNGKKISFDHSKANELVELESVFEKMTIDIDNLIKTNEEMSKRKRKAELDVLQAQINPHFIYNILDSISWIAKTNKETLIENMTYSLASFLRIGLHNGKEMISVSEEIMHAKSYVEIEQIRFPNSFIIKYDIDPEILNCKIIKIILQPLIENAIKHGFNKRHELGHITINGYAQNEYLIFSVTDDGNGTDESIIECMNHKSSGGFGLFNISERIALKYGDDCGLTFHSKSGVGTTVTIKLKKL